MTWWGPIGDGDGYVAPTVRRPTEELPPVPKKPVVKPNRVVAEPVSTRPTCVGCAHRAVKGSVTCGRRLCRDLE